MNQSPTQATTTYTALPQNPAGRNRRWLILLLLLPMLACGLPGVVPQPPFHPTGQIVFECWPDRTTSRLCLVNADGTGYRQLTDKTTDKRPYWSPDGEQIVFVRQGNDQNFTTSLFVMNLDGSNLLQLTDMSIAAGSPSWSLSSNVIAFTYHKKEDGPSGTALVNPKSGALKFLTNSSEVEPVWSPDGTQIAYEIHKPTNISNIYVMDPDGLNQTQLTSAYSEAPSWSPDGTKIAFTCGGVCVINSDGSGSTQLDERGRSPSWSPDGQYIVFHRSDPTCILCPNSGQLWVMRADGSQPTRITDGPVDQNPAWMPEP